MKIKHIIKVADFFTIGNLIFGSLSIFYAIDKQFTPAAFFLFVAVAFDFFDGKIARVSKKITEEGRLFGKELDSLADMVSFGVAPAVFGYTRGLSAWLAVLILLFFVTAGMLRLSRFNVTKAEGFEGIPITFNGIIFPGLYFLSVITVFPLTYNLAAYLFMGFAMLSTRKIKKLI